MSKLLSELEEYALTDPKNLSARQKRNLRFRLKKKLSLINPVIKDIYLILNVLPEDEIIESIDAETVLLSMKITEAILKRLKLPQVEPRSMDGGKKWESKTVYRFNVTGMKNVENIDPVPLVISFESLPDEKDLCLNLANHAKIISNYVNQPIDKTVYSVKEFQNELQKIVENRGQISYNVAMELMASSPNSEEGGDAE